MTGPIVTGHSRRLLWICVVAVVMLFARPVVCVCRDRALNQDIQNTMVPDLALISGHTRARMVPDLRLISGHTEHNGSVCSGQSKVR